MSRSLSRSRRKLAEEARPLASVADVPAAQAFHFQQDRVLVAKPVAIVRSSASRFMKPTIRTSFVFTSCTTAGISPSSFEKSMCVDPGPSLAGPPWPTSLRHVAPGATNKKGLADHRRGLQEILL